MGGFFAFNPLILRILFLGSVFDIFLITTNFAYFYPSNCVRWSTSRFDITQARRQQCLMNQMLHPNLNY